MPPHASKFFYFLAPFIAVILALVSIAVIPFGPQVPVPGGSTFMEISDINVGILFVLAVGAISVYGIALAGWSSNNKYSLMGGLRSSAQMISYELPFTFAIVSPLLLANHLSFRGIAEQQAGYYLHLIPRWSIFQLPFPQVFGFIIFMIAGFAETNRIPFDLPEAENELVAGFHTEYSSMKFASFFMAEYANMVTISLWPPSVPGRLASSVPRALVELGSLDCLCLSGSLVIYPGWQNRPQMGSHHLPTIRHGSLGFGFDFRHSLSANLFGAYFLVCFEGRRHPLYLYLDSWHSAALPLRPTHAFCVDIPVSLALANLLLTALFVALFPNQK